MTNKLTKINFDREKVGAIVLPPTEYDTQIVIDSVLLDGKRLHVYYKVDQKQEKRTYTIVPAKVFTFNANLGVDTVIFRSGNEVTEIAVK